MTLLQRAGGLLLAALLAGCGSNVKGPKGGSETKGKIAGKASELIVGKWDQVQQRASEKPLVDRCEYPRDGKSRFWFLKRPAAGLKTLDGAEPAEPVNEGPYRFLD